MKLLIENAEIVDVPAKKLNKRDHYRFPCGCEFRIRKDLPPVLGQHFAIDYDLENVPLDCPAVWDLLASGRTKGIFQLESNLGRHWVKKVKPRSIQHLSDMVAILRPGVLNARDEATGLTMAELYVKRKNGELDTVYEIEATREILGSTYNVMLYQEQLISLVTNLAGFDLVEADTFRKACGKKLAALMEEAGSLFISKAETFGVITKKQAESLFENMRKSGKYLFNRCLAFDTILMRPKGGSKSGYTVEEMYKIRNDIPYAQATGHNDLRKKWKRLGHYGNALSLCEDGRIRPNIISDIQPAGVRPVYRLTLANGASMRVTGNHKFPTSLGEMTLDEIRKSDKTVLLYTRGEYEPSDFKLIGRFSPPGTKRSGDLRSSTSVNKQFGEANYSYTNGSYTKFMEFKNSTPDVCFVCERTKAETRIETHHINGDRANSEPENLEKLCASCHKKKQYAMGRTKKGEKGYPSVMVAVRSIEPDGECMTYDVTMNTPNHNFVVESGIVTSNSHSVSYGLNSYWTAHWKAHFPLYFFCSYLYWAKEKKQKGGPLKEIRGVVTEAKSFGIEVLPPRFIEMKNHFGTDGLKVTFGLADTKGIGDKIVNKMREAIPGVEETAGTTRFEWSWFEYLRYFAGIAGAGATRTMIEVGALRDLGDYQRVRLLHEFDCYEALTANEQAAIAALGEPLYQERAVKRTVEVEKPTYDKSAMKAYRAAMKEYKRLKGEGQEGQVGLTQPTHPPQIGTEIKPKKVSVRDDAEDIIYERVLDAAGEPVVLDGPRVAHCLEDALEGILERPGAITSRRRETVAGILKTLRNPATTMVDKPYWIAKKEEENLGIPLTVSHVESADRSIVNCTVKEFQAGKQPKRGAMLIIGVEVQEVHEHAVRQGPNEGRKMGRLVGSDETGALEDVVVFADAWEKYGSMLLREGNIVALGGKPHWNPADKSFVVEQVWVL